jgi:hypothetical protein
MLLVDTIQYDMHYPYLPCLQTLNLAHNQLDRIPTAWEATWGNYDDKSGSLRKDESSSIVVMLIGNPFHEA